MSTLAPPRDSAPAGWRAPPPPLGREPSRRPPRPTEPAASPLAARLAAFLALALFASAHWTAFVARGSGGGILLAVLAATGTAAALALGGRPRVVDRFGRLGARRGRAGLLAARLAAAWLGLALGALAVGLPARYLRPRRWDDLWERIDRSLPAVYRAQWPYDGAEAWVALTVLLAVPAACTTAAALGFWPGRWASARRVAALAVLVALYGVAVTERPLGSDLVRGTVLLGLVGAWLWLPRLARRDVRGAGAAVLAAGALAVVLGGAMRERPALVDYESWSIWDRNGVAQFNWTHSYGPISWPRDGTTLLYVRARRAHYWKVQSLDGFDGVRWFHSGARDRTSTGADVPDAPGLRRRWLRRLRFTVSALRSEWVTSAGATEFVRTADRAIDTYTTPSGVRTVGRPLRKGDSYLAQAYVPEPGAGDLRRAGPPDPDDDWLRLYTQVSLPAPGDTAPNDPAPGPGTEIYSPEPVDIPVRGITFGGLPEDGARRERRAARRLAASPYAGVYQLAQRLGAGTTTQYALVRRVERHLRETGGFSYTEDPPERRLPLRDFLLDTKIGYCQHFSGAMALMLRMNGVPARVAAGFSPGSYNRDTQEFRVRDLDAHSWVEVWFDGLGWIAFDPTPPLAPASSQTGDLRGADVARGGAPTGASLEPGSDLPAEVAAEDAIALDDGLSRWWIAPFGVLGAAGGLLGALWLRARVLRRRLAPGDDPDVVELEGALRRLGYPVPAGTTLLALERRVERLGGPEARRYVRRLRDRRFAAGPARPPSAADRRALRRGLGRGAGRLGAVRALLALPPVPLRAPSRSRRGPPPRGRATIGA